MAHYVIVKPNPREEARCHIKYSRRLVDGTRREIREAAEHIAESERIIDEAQKRLKRPYQSPSLSQSPREGRRLAMQGRMSGNPG
jgi:hypothetical protein